MSRLGFVEIEESRSLRLGRREVDEGGGSVRVREGFERPGHPGGIGAPPRWQEENRGPIEAVHPATSWRLPAHGHSNRTGKLVRVPFRAVARPR